MSDRKEYFKEYGKNIRTFRVNLHKKNEKELLEFLEKKDNKQGYIKTLLYKELIKENEKNKEN